MALMNKFRYLYFLSFPKYQFCPRSAILFRWLLNFVANKIILSLTSNFYKATIPSFTTKMTIVLMFLIYSICKTEVMEIA